VLDEDFNGNVIGRPEGFARPVGFDKLAGRSLFSVANLALPVRAFASWISMGYAVVHGFTCGSPLFVGKAARFFVRLAAGRLLTASHQVLGDRTANLARERTIACACEVGQFGAQRVRQIDCHLRAARYPLRRRLASN
jgi:hypothetical protein